MVNAIRRQVLFSLLGTVALAARGQAPAQRRRVAFVGFKVMFEGPNGYDETLKVLARRGWTEGGRIDVARVVIEVKPGSDKEGHGLDFLVPILEREVAAARPDVIVAVSSIMAGGLSRVTKSIPIVTSVSDPVEMGLAQSLARPGGNVTGISHGLAETALKTMEFAKALVPRLSRVAIFHDSRTMAVRFAAAWERAAKAAALDPVMAPGVDEPTLLRALQAIPPRSVQAGMLTWPPPGSDGALYREAIARRLPLIGAHEQDAESGALVSYFAQARQPHAERLAEVVEQVLRGGDPATIPFRYPDAFRLVVNQKTAKALGIAVAPDLLLRADRVIE